MITIDGYVETAIVRWFGRVGNGHAASLDRVARDVASPEGGVEFEGAVRWLSDAGVLVDADTGGPLRGRFARLSDSVVVRNGCEVFRLGPDGRPFVWGEIVGVHGVGPYAIVEYADGRSGETMFHPYVGGADTNRGYGSLDRALLGAVAFRSEGSSARSGEYAALMMRLPERES